MFKKPFKVATSNLISGKDRKKLITDLEVSFDKQSLKIIFDYYKEFTADKLSGLKSIIYSSNEIPLFVDSTGKNDYVPTLYALFLAPKLIPFVQINQGVESFIFKGANLMWPGVQNSNDLGEFNEDDVRAIKASNGSFVAIGAMACSKEDNSNQGICCVILHYIGEHLWEYGPKTVLKSIEEQKAQKVEEKQEEKAKEAEKPKNVEKVSAPAQQQESQDEDDDDGASELLSHTQKQQPAKQKQESDSDQDEEALKNLVQNKGGQQQAVPTQEVTKKENLDSDSGDDKQTQGKHGKQADKKSNAAKKQTEADDQKNQNKKETAAKTKQESVDDKGEEDSDENNTEEQKTQGGAANTQPSIPLAVMDEYIRESFLNCLKISVNDKQMPMDSSQFYSNHMLKCKRENIEIDLKNSTFKKISKFFQVMDKEGFIEYKEAKKGTNPMITQVYRDNAKYTEWEPTIGQASTGQKDEGKEEKQNAEEFKVKVDIEELYKPSLEVAFIFGKVDKDSYLNLTQIKDNMTNYITTQKLLQKKMVKMNDQLFGLVGDHKTEEDEAAEDAENQKQIDNADEGEIDLIKEEIEKQKEKRGQKEDPRIISREDLWKRLQKYMTPYYQIVNHDRHTNDIKMGNFKGIHLSGEKTHNKNITKITGLQIFFTQDDITALSNKFQTKFACSVSFHELPAKGKEVPLKEMIVHGNFVTDLIDFFSNDCKIDRQYITSINKLDQKKK